LKLNPERRKSERRAKGERRKNEEKEFHFDKKTLTGYPI
jgi:hypothetical protein